MDFGRRLDRLREAIASAEIDALLVTRAPNIRYLTGFTGSAGMVLVGGDEIVVVTDGRYATQAAEQLGDAGVPARIEITPTPSDQRGTLVACVSGFGRLGLEAQGVTWAQQRLFAEWFDSVELVATESMVEVLRAVKDEAEVTRMRTACGIADAALGDVLDHLCRGPTEREFARLLEEAMLDRGAARTSFETIVASGPNGAKPHARPTDRRIGTGELVVIDYGCVVDGYCSDATRTVSVGDPGSPASDIWEVVARSQAAGRGAVRPGIECREVDRVSRAVIEAAGWGDAFVHGTGHGVGLEIHESPRVAASADGTLVAGCVVTIEPGIYVPGLGGVRLEDTVVVTEDGADALTTFPKFLTVQPSDRLLESP
jgi:Xaa-Pro aminopeptidase